jgi:hypothetical protein
VDACGKDSSIDNIGTQLTLIKAQLQGVGKNKLGFSDNDVQAHYEDAVNAAVNEAVTPMIANKDFSGAKNIINQFQGDMGKEVKEGFLQQINTGIWNNQKDAESKQLFQKYGENMNTVYSKIENDSSLDAQKKDELFTAYRTQVGIHDEMDNEYKKNLIDKGVSNDIVKAGNLTNAMASIDRDFPLTNFKSAQVRETLHNIANQQYGVNNIKTDPQAWMQVNDLIHAGKVKSEWDLYAGFGKSISWGDMKSFINALDKTSNDPYNKWSLGSDGLKMLASNGVTDPQQRANFWDSYANTAGDFQLQNKRKPTDGELHDLMAKSLAKVKVGEWQMRPFGIPLDETPGIGGLFKGDVQDNAFKVPQGFKWDTKNNAYVGYDDQGNKVKYVP